MLRPDHQRQIETHRVHQQTLQDVVGLSQVRSSHAARLVHVRETAFHQLRPDSLQLFPSSALHPSPVGVYSLLLHLPAPPLPAPAFRLRNVTSHRFLMQRHQRCCTVVALVSHNLFDTPFIEQLRMGLCFPQRLVHGRGVALIGLL